MGKTLLQDLTVNNEAHEITATVSVGNEKNALSALMNEMSGHLQDAARDLLQPRPEVIEKLMKKALD